MLRDYPRLPYSKLRNPVTPSRQNQNFQSDTLIDLAYAGTMLWGCMLACSCIANFTLRYPRMYSDCRLAIVLEVYVLVKTLFILAKRVRHSRTVNVL